MDFLRPFEGRIYGAVRIVVGFLFLCHGVQKIMAIANGDPSQLPAPLLYGATLIETVGGALVAVGFLTSPAAFLCSGTMAVAYFMAHQSNGLLPIQNGGELAAVYAWVFLFIAARGAGPLSLEGSRDPS